MAKKTYLPIRWDRRYGSMLHTFRCPKCHVSCVESSSGVTLDARHQKKDPTGIGLAATHVCDESKK